MFGPYLKKKKVGELLSDTSQIFSNSLKFPDF